MGRGRHRAPRRRTRALAPLRALVRGRPDAVVSTAVVVGLTLLLWRPSLAHLATWSQARDGEEGLYLFWFAHFPHAVLHGHSPFVTDYVNAPDGLNATWNTSVLAPAALFAPVTVLAGPVLAYNLAVLVSMAGTAGACVAACRRFVTWWPAALAGGCLAGFGPYPLLQAQGHLNISCAAVPALLVLVGHELLVRQRTRRRTLALLIGGLLALQFGISTELLASTGVLAVAAVLVLLAQGRARPGRWDAARVRYAATAAGAGLGVALVLLAWPLYEVLLGHQHLSGPVQSLDVLSADLLAPVLPTGRQLLAPDAAVRATAGFSGNAVENTAYVGVPLLLLALGAVLLLRRRAVGGATVRFAAAMALVSLVLSLGSHLRVDGHRTAVPLPFAALAASPLLESAAAVRYSFATLLFLGVLAAVALDAGRRWARAARPPARAARPASAARSGRPTRSVLLGAACALVVLPLLPSTSAPYRSVPLDVPAFYTGGAVRAAVPEGGVVVSYPYLSRFATLPLTEQALSGLRYRQLGVYGFTPAPGTGAGRFDVPTAAAYAEGRIERGVLVDPSRTFAVVLELADRHVDAVVVDEAWPGAERAVAFWSGVLRRPPLRTGGVAVWSDVPRLLSGR